jgi:hypothetical protein
MTLGHFVTHKKNPFNEWHWILFYTCLSSEAKAKRKRTCTQKNNIKKGSQDSHVIKL